MKLVKQIILLIFLILILQACEKDSTTSSESSEYTSNNSYNTVWSDEFDEDELNEEYWSFQIGSQYGGWGNNELEYYTEDNVELSNGTLKIIAKEESVGGFNYTSSRIRTINKVDFTYGVIEVRAKLPKGQGIWPAIWLLATDEAEYGGWPNCGEIDIMELLGHEPNIIHGNIHGPGYSGAAGKIGDYTLERGSFFDDFHVFKINWNVDGITWYIDDELFHSISRADIEAEGLEWVFNHDFYVLMNVAVGGNWPGSPDSTTEFPQQMEIDYIRINQ